MNLTKKQNMDETLKSINISLMERSLKKIIGEKEPLKSKDISLMEPSLKKIIGEKDLKIINSLLTDEEKALVIKYRHAIKLANVMDYAFWLGKKNHITVYANQIYQNLTEYSLEECLGKPADFCFDEESKKRIEGHHSLRKKGISSKYEAAYITKTGKKIPVLVIGAPTDSGGSYGIHIDLRLIKKLEQKKRIFEQVIRNSTEAIIVLDKNRKINLWNAGAVKIFEYEEAEMLNKNLNILIPNDQKEKYIKVETDVEKTNNARNIELKFSTKSQKIIDISLSETKVVDEDGIFIGYLGIYRDITQQKRVDTELQKRFEAIQDAYKELGLQKRQSDYLNEIAEMGISKNGIESLAKLIISAASLITKCDGVILRLYEKERGILKLITCLGVNAKWQSKGAILFKNSLAEDAFINKRPIIIHDIDSSPKHRGTKLVKSHGFKTLIVIPLFIEGEVLGSISLYTKDPGKFRLIETDFLENFGRQCSLALFAKMK